MSGEAVFFYDNGFKKNVTKILTTSSCDNYSVGTIRASTSVRRGDDIAPMGKFKASDARLQIQMNEGENNPLSVINHFDNQLVSTMSASGYTQRFDVELVEDTFSDEMINKMSAQGYGIALSVKENSIIPILNKVVVQSEVQDVTVFDFGGLPGSVVTNSTDDHIDGKLDTSKGAKMPMIKPEDWRMGQSKNYTFFVPIQLDALQYYNTQGKQPLQVHLYTIDGQDYYFPLEYEYKKKYRKPKISNVKTRLGNDNQVFLDALFQDSDGDVDYLDFTVTGAISHYWTWDANNIPSVKQIQGTSTGELIMGTCPLSGGVVEIAVRAFDKTGNVSDTYSAEYDCESSSPPVMLDVTASNYANNPYQTLGNFYYSDPDGDVARIYNSVTGVITKDWRYIDVYTYPKASQIGGIWTKNWDMGQCSAHGESFSISAYAIDKKGNVSNTVTKSYSCPGSSNTNNSSDNSVGNTSGYPKTTCILTTTGPGYGKQYICTVFSSEYILERSYYRD